MLHMTLSLGLIYHDFAFQLNTMETWIYIEQDNLWITLWMHSCYLYL